MRLDYQILLKSPPLTLLAGSAPVRDKRESISGVPRWQKGWRALF